MTAGVVRVTHDRLSDVVEFLARAYGTTGPGAASGDPAARWRWSIEGYPFRPDGGLPSWVHIDDGRIVGHVGAFPVEIAVHGATRGMAWARDLIVAPEARGRGIGSGLMMTVTQHAGVSGVLGHGDTYPLYRKIGYIDMGRVPQYVKVLDRAQFASAFAGDPVRRGVLRTVIPVIQARPARTRAASSVPVERLASFDATFDRWWRTVEPSFGSVIRRRSEVMSWHYTNDPWRRYTALAIGGLRGVAVVRRGLSRGVRVGIIVELLAHPEDRDAIRALIHAAEDQLVGDPGSPSIVFLRANVLHRAFEHGLVHAGFVPTPSPIEWILAGADGATSLASLRDRAAWYLNAGDSDIDLW